MSRLLLALVVVFAGGLSAMAQDAPRIAPRPLQGALAAVADGRDDRAAQLAARAGPAAEALVAWSRLRAGRGTPAEVMAFLTAYPDWPGLARLRRESEPAIARAGDDTVLAFFDDRTPQTGEGALAHARALSARGRIGEARAGVVLAWRTLDLSEAEHDAFLDAHAALLAPHHAARLRMALWRGLRDVRQMLPLVDDRTRRLAEIRQTIEAGETVAEADMPEGASEDPVIAHALFERHIRNNRTDAAIALLRAQSRVEGGLGAPERWAGWRRYLARAQMRAGEAETAYALAARHGLVEGSNYADLEWLSGYIALTYLDAPGRALDHFQRFRAAVETPISLGRAGYWIGRAQAAAGDGEGAQIAYEFGAQYQTSFYGLLAAERAGLPPDPALAGNAGGEGWRDAAFRDTALYKAGVLLRAAGRPSLAEWFFESLADTLDAGGVARLGRVLEEMGAPHLQVMVGKAAARRGIVVPAPYFALHPLHEMELPVPAELALAIARRESEFDADVRSGAGAMGLMQLMPGTAAEMAGERGLAHARGRLMSDWRYNARLGAAYLAQLTARFDGNVTLVAAAYNAGPSRALRWMEARGDPRGRPEAEIVDWIEHIPFRETRNYVMRTAESLPVYRARLGRAVRPVPFPRELAGATLLPRGE